MARIPERPEMGAFEPYRQAFDATALRQLLASYGREQGRGIYESAAERGLTGSAGVVPGKIDLAQTQMQALARGQMQHEQQQNMAVQQQYIQYVGQKYGLQSAEYEMAYKDYMQKYAFAEQFRQRKYELGEQARMALIQGLMGLGGKAIGFATAKWGGG